MVARYVPEAGDIAWLDFDPQAGRGQGRRRPVLVLTDQAYNRASGLVVVCPLTSKRKPYPFALPVVVRKVEGAVLVDHLQKHGLEGEQGNFSLQGRPCAAGQDPHLRRRPAAYPLSTRRPSPVLSQLLLK